MAVQSWPRNGSLGRDLAPLAEEAQPGDFFPVTPELGSKLFHPDLNGLNL
jgi:hypothetical protein